jgi:putative redox protein
MEVEGKRKEVKGARPFESAHVTIYLEGDINPDKAKRAAALSFEKYCSVSITIEGCVKVTYEIVLNGNVL